MQITKAMDMGDAPETWIAGVASVSMLAPGVVEVTFFRDFESNYEEGDIERKVVDRQLWSLQGP